MLYYTSTELTSKEMKAAIANRIHYERCSANLSLESFADKLSYSKPTVYKWEKGWKGNTGENTIPTMEQLMELCTFFHCEPGYLLCEYDLKSRPATDVSLSTGLMQENIQKLNNMVTRIIDPDLNAGAYDLFLAFINYFLSNCDMLLELIFNRQILEYTRLSYEENEHKSLIYETYKEISESTNRPASMFKDGIFEYSPEKDLKDKLYEKFINMGFDKKTSEEKAKDGASAVDILANIKTPQSDFVISEEFLGITRSFFEIFDDLRFDYSHFMEELAKRNISSHERKSTETP